MDPLPANVRVEAFIPHAHLLPHLDVIVTNGGYNGVQMALANEVPLVAAGPSEDKPEGCARIAWAGVGINFKTNSPTSEQMRVAVMKVLANRDYKHRAEHLKVEIARHHAPKTASELLIQLADTKKPILSAIRGNVPRTWKRAT